MTDPTPTLVTLPPAPRPARNLWVALGLSALLPGVGLIYVGLLPPALGFLVVWLAVRPLLSLLLTSGALQVATWWWADQSVDLGLRLLAVGFTFVALRRHRQRPLPVVPPGVYGLSLLVVIGLRALISNQLQNLLPIIELSADGMGLRRGEYVQGRKTGPFAQPQPGVTALYLFDAVDAGFQNPAAPIKRDAFVGLITETHEKTFSVEGLDASVPNDDYVGEALGVILSRGAFIERLGVAPSTK